MHHYKLYPMIFFGLCFLFLGIGSLINLRKGSEDVGEDFQCGMVAWFSLTFGATFLYVAMEEW